MECHEIKELIPAYSNKDVSQEDVLEIEQHLKDCEDCRNEYNLIVKSWNVLEAWKDVEPESGYVSRFWTRLSKEPTWVERFGGMKDFLVRKSFVPAYAGALVMVLVGVLVFQSPLLENRSSKALLEEDVAFVESLDLAENIDLLQAMDWLEDLEAIENFEPV